MFCRKRSHIERATFAWIVAVAVATTPAAAQQFKGSTAGSLGAGAHWETEARMHGAFCTKDRGTLVINGNGVEFRREHGDTRKWAFVDIDTFSITSHQLVIRTFANRSLHRPGEKSYRFDLAQIVPPFVAASLATDLDRPSRNRIPDPESQAIASIPVRHRRLTGSTYGVLRFWKEGIDYVTSVSGDGRSWRWADLQTLSDPDPYHLFVFGYRDTYTFDLKEPLSRKTFNWATDEIYAHTRSEPMNSHEDPLPPSRHRQKGEP